MQKYTVNEHLHMRLNGLWNYVLNYSFQSYRASGREHI
uniref:Uncharacterized protein n=1 Tax=Arundo donax TaxID=35708 RepID=A0A0A9AIR2_ARUDO